MVNTPLIKIEIDNEVIEKHILENIKTKIRKVEHTKIYYSLDDLSYITSFSIGHIKNTFFEDYRFKEIRRKVGRKWVFPVKETNIFLKTWICEQPNN